MLLPLDEGSVRDAAALLAPRGVESVAVCLLHSYVNPEHERRIGAILAEELPGVPVSLSAEVAPEFREYLRAQHDRDQRRASGRSSSATSSGSSSGSREAGVQREAARDAVERRRVQLRGGAPPAGLHGRVRAGGGRDRVGVSSASALGLEDILSFDMGGTTAKVGLIQGGKPVGDQGLRGRRATPRPAIGGMSLSGYPMRTPVVDLVEIGAGGGSIAWVDSGGLLRVGPQSAGADPGPGLLRARRRRADRHRRERRARAAEPAATSSAARSALDVEGARRAIEERCAQPLGLDVVEAANGIVEIANAAMVNALRLISVQRGYDPRDFVLVAFGGAGPVHANALARDAEMPTLLVPRSPGIFSATGLLATDLKRDASSTVMRRLDALDPGEVEAAFAVLERAGAAELARGGPRGRRDRVRGARSTCATSARATS